MTAYVWVGGSNTSWTNHNNWNPSSGYPDQSSSSDTVTINSGASNYPNISSGSGFTIAQLAIASGGQLTITSSAGTARTLTVSGASNAVTNAGTITLTGNGSNASSLIVSGAGGLSNSATGVINGATASALSGGVGGIANAGAINVNSGTMTVTSGLTDTGASKINISSGATLTTNSALTNTSGAITINGTLTATGSAPVSNAGTISLAGTLNSTGVGGVTNSGTINVSTTGALNGGLGGTTNKGAINVGGTLTVTGALTNNAVGASISVYTAATLSTSGALTNTSGAININGTLTETGATAIGNSGTITLTGGTLSDSGAGGVTNSGTITSSGASTLNVGATNAISNSGNLNVTGGTLTVTGLITDTGSSSQINISSGATLTTSQLITNSAGAITLSGGTLNDTGGVILTAGSMTGNGTVNLGGAALTGNGSLVASGGTLSVTAQIDGADGTGTTNFEIGDGWVLNLASSSAVGTTLTNPTLTFDGSAGGRFQDSAATAGTVHLGQISGFSGTDAIVLSSFTSTAGGDSWSVSGNTLTITNGASSESFTFAAGTSMAGLKVTDSGTTNAITICFMPGTGIATPDGKIAIETLKPGDLVLTADGDARQVRWLGRQSVSTLFADPVRVLPIRVKAGALAEQVPHRDLLVSPDHALLVDGVMIHAGALVNGSSIVREPDVPRSFTYYHVELDDHSLILAENVPAETFVDNVDRMNFDNWAEHEALWPDGKAVSEMPLPRAKSHRQVPGSIHAALARRAEIIGAAERAVA